jgi:hypothetical protein
MLSNCLINGIWSRKLDWANFTSNEVLIYQEDPI